MSLVRLPGLFLRRLRAEAAPSLAMAALVLVTAFLFGAAPGFLASTGDDALRSTVASHRAADRNVELVEQTRICACDGADPLADAEAEGERLQAEVPDRLRSAIVDRVLAVDTTRWYVVEPQHTQAVLTIRFEPRAVDHLTIVAGRLPGPTERTVTLPAVGQLPEVDAPVIEVALVEASADRLGVGIGDTFLLRPDPRDPLTRVAPVGAAVEVVGIYRVPQPNDAFWYDEQALLRPTERVYSAEVQFLDVYALAGSAGYPSLLTSTAAMLTTFGRPTADGLPIHYRWRLFVDPARLDAAGLGQLEVDLRRLESTHPASGLPDGGAIVHTLLPTILAREDVAWRSALAVVAVAAAGPAVIAAAAFGLVALLALGRRRATAWLWRVRGASALQLGVVATVEALLLAVPAAAAAFGLVALGSPSGPALVESAIAIAAVAGVAVAIVDATVARLPDPSAPPAAARPHGVERRRLVIEGGLVAIAAAAVLVLRERTVNAAGGAGSVGVDPLVVAAPALAGLAAGVVARRLLPIPLAIAAHAAGSGRGLAVALGLRRASRGGGSALLLVLLATVSVGTFSALALGQLARAADVIGWHDVGAPFRISADGGVLPPTLAGDASAAGADATASAYRTVISAASAGGTIDLLSIDVPSYERLAAGLPLDADLPAELLASASGVRHGDPVPIVISRSLAAGPAALHVGSELAAVVDGHRSPLRVVGVRDTFPTLDPTVPFVIASTPQLAASRGVSLQATDLLVRAPDAAEPALRELAASQATPMTITSRATDSAGVRDSPIVRAVRAWLAVAAVAGAAYAALAVVAALALAAVARAAETGILRTFGLTRRQATGLVVAEHGPVVALAFALGALIGAGLFVALRPGLGLAGVVGSPLEIPLAIEPPVLIAILGYVAAVAAVGIGVGVWIERRPHIATIIRRGTG
jgi:putative ABC transport system permease protein